MMYVIMSGMVAVADVLSGIHATRYVPVLYVVATIESPTPRTEDRAC